MPSGKKSKEDTWTENDLMKAIKGETKEKKHRTSREKASREKDKVASDDKVTEKRKREHKTEHEKHDKGEKERHSRHRSEGKGEVDRGDQEKRQRQHKTEDESGNLKHAVDKERKHRRHKTEDESEVLKHDTEKEQKHRRHRTEESDEIIKKEPKKKVDAKKEHRTQKGESKHKEDKERRHSSKAKETEAERQKRHDEKRRGRDKASKQEKDPTEHKERRREKDRDKERTQSNKEKDKHREGSGNERHKEKDSHSGKDKDRGSRKVEKEKSMKEDDKDKKEKARKDREKELLKALAEEEKQKKEEPATVDEGDDGDYDYEDDFDDYDDDDFEDDDDDDDDDGEDNDENENEPDEDGRSNEDDNEYMSDENEKIQAQTTMLHLTQSEQNGINEVLKAISDENDFAASQANKIRSTSGSKRAVKNEESLPQQKKSFGKINFIAASQKQINEKTAKKTKKRGQELLQLVQLDIRSFDIFDMPPMTEYELYMKRFGQSDSKQISVQTNDDNLTQETQTDERETESRWCQFSHDIKGCGTDTNDDTDSTINSVLSTNSARLNKFLLKASQVCISLLEELEAGIEQRQRQYTESRTSFSDGYVTLESSNFLVLGRDFCDLAYSMSQTNMLLTAYGASNVVKKEKHKSPKGLICVWNTNEPTKPHKLLTCESIPRSCCFSSGRASIAFAGMDDGVVALWDLREPETYHEEIKVGNHTHIFRTATFTTSALTDNHEFPVVCLSPITSNRSYDSGVESEGDIDISFQLASLDQSGVVNIWIIVEVQIDSTDLSTVEDDLGLSPRGRLKLVKSAKIRLTIPSSDSLRHLFSVTCLQINPSKPNHLYTGTDQGEILHLARFGNRPILKVLRQSEGNNVKVNAIDISPWKMPYLLACYDDGSVHLFNLKKETPVGSWMMFSNNSPIVDIKWSRSKPNIFFAIDERSVIYAWDLLKSDVEPVLQETLKRKDKRAIGFAFANDHASLGQGTPGRAAEMGLVYGDGSVEIHRLSKTLCHMNGDELDSTQQYFDSIT